MDNIYKHNYLFIIILIVTFLISFSIYKDFGISIDEESTRYHGLVSLNYIIEVFNFNFDPIENIKRLETYEYREYSPCSLSWMRISKTIKKFSTSDIYTCI